MSFLIGLIIATVLLFLTIAVFATKIFFPYHRIIALLVYAIGWIPFLYSLSLRKKWLLQNQDKVTSFLQGYWMYLLFVLLMALLLYVILVIFPPEKSAFAGMNDQEIEQLLKDDKTVILYLNNKLKSILEEADGTGALAVDFSKITNQEKVALENTWVYFVEAILELDLLKERYKTFYKLNVLTKRDLHEQAFENGYTALLLQHYYTLQLSKKVIDSNVITYLNQSFDKNGISRDTFDLFRSKITNVDELLRLNTGRAYHLIVGKQESELDQLIVFALKGIDASFKDYANLISKKPLNFLEKNSFKLWMPLQKQSAIQISYIRTATRDYHIQPELIQKYKEKFLIGDILLERREWHATNIGIPGFWTHNALFLGTLDEMNAYFNALPELKGQSFQEFLQKKYPEAYAKMLEKDEKGYAYAIIESMRPGVILSSLEHTANADSFAVLRVRGLTPYDRFKIVTQALQYFGRPYDFDFNFVTDNALVCSELIYKAYLDIKRLTLKLGTLNGRLIISPNQFAEKFTKEFNNKDAELELVFFLDGNEKERIVMEKDAEVFKETWERPKWHIAKDFVNFQ